MDNGDPVRARPAGEHSDASLTVAEQARRASLLGMLRSGDGQSSLSQRIYEELAVAIIEGKLKPLEDLNSVDLGSRFSTSRTPVREALQRLERDGLVVVPMRRRPYVSPFDMQQIRDSYHLRAQLAALVSSFVIERATDRELRDLWHWQGALEADARGGTFDEFFWHSVEFNNCELRLGKNDELVRIVTSLGIRTLRYWRLSLTTPDRMNRAVDDRRRLLVAYDERDKDSAAAIARALALAELRAIADSPVAQSGRRD